MFLRSLKFTLCLLLLSCTSLPTAPTQIEVPVDETLQRVLREVDNDKDNKITVHDGKNLTFALPEQKAVLKGAYPISILLQELTLAREKKLPQLEISWATLNENPVDRTSQMIREIFWQGLTRKLDEKGIPHLVDPKTSSAGIYLYTPNGDAKAFKYYSDVAKRLKTKGFTVHVEKLPIVITPAYVRKLDGKHGVLTLALEEDANGQIIGGKPFVVPGGRFNEMYGWDSYFIILGLLSDGKIELARSMVDNLVYEIEHYGKILNANRTYYLTRSQPPFTTSAIRAVYDKLPATARSKDWLLKSMRAAYTEYRSVWMAAPHLVEEFGLSRYYGEGLGPSPEVEPGHYNTFLQDYVGKPPFEKTKTAEELYRALMAAYKKDPRFRYPDARVEDFFVQDRAIRESGHDTTYRFEDRATDFLTVDLNSLLYKTETDFRDLMETGLLPRVGEFGDYMNWKKSANDRKAKMMALMWDEEKQMFFDYDIKNKKQSGYISATMFYPMWAKMLEPPLAKPLTQAALKHLLQNGGLSSTALESLQAGKHQPGTRQWDYPNGWAPHQILAWQGLRNYGLNSEANDLIKRWITMIADNARDYNGTVPEKFNVVTRSHAVFEEYGNVGTQFDYITKEGFGWMNSSFVLGREILRQ